MRRQVINYSLAVVASVAVTAAKYALPVLGQGTPFSLYHLVIFLAAIFLGTGPAVVALVFASGAVDFLFLRHSLHFVISVKSVTDLAVFIFDGVVIIWLIDRYRRYSNKIAQQRDELETLTGQLREANDRITRLLAEAVDSGSTRRRRQPMRKEENF